MMDAVDDAPRVAEVFAIGIGECGSNLVGAYLKQTRERLLSLIFGLLSKIQS